MAVRKCSLQLVDPPARHVPQTFFGVSTRRMSFYILRVPAQDLCLREQPIRH